MTLHVGAGTFLPVKVDDIRDHRMHAEWGEIAARDRAGDRRNPRSRRPDRRDRHHVAAPAGNGGGGRWTRVAPFSGDTDIFITPGYRFKVVDLLLTNFHLPRSTLFMLVSAFAGMERMRAAYAHAISLGLPLLFLWRHFIDRESAMTATDRFRAWVSMCMQPTARPGAAR